MQKRQRQRKEKKGCFSRWKHKVKDRLNKSEVEDVKKYGDVRRSLAVSAILMAVLFLLPLAVVTPMTALPPEQPETVVEPQPFVSGLRDGERLLRVLIGEEVVEMDLGTYLVGVLRAEMPASFAAEALKAQSVAARTYTLYHMRNTSAHEKEFPPRFLKA